MDKLGKLYDPNRVYSHFETLIKGTTKKKNDFMISNTQPAAHFARWEST